MKKILFIIIALTTTSQFSFAQWTPGPGNINNTNTGNVGIGTTNPQAKLHIVGGEIRLAGAGTSGIASGATITFYDSNNTTQYGFLGDASAGNSDIYMTANAGNSLRFGTNGVNDRMFISTSGNIGIGTTNPLYPLSVVGPTSNIFSASDGTRGVLIQAQSTPLSNGGIIGFYNGIYNDLDIRALAGVGAQLYLKTNGNVSIGTTDGKGYKFAVNGSAIATSMTVKLNANWPDYVFKADYQLPSLSEVKNYIDQNHHLPEMPSEQSVEKDGLNLGETNRLLVKKVEELTLYLIEKDGELKRQESELTAQKDIDRILDQRLKKIEDEIETKYKKEGN